MCFNSIIIYKIQDTLRGTASCLFRYIIIIILSSLSFAFVFVLLELQNIFYYFLLCVAWLNFPYFFLFLLLNRIRLMLFNLYDVSKRYQDQIFFCYSAFIDKLCSVLTEKTKKKYSNFLCFFINVLYDFTILTYWFKICDIITSWMQQI